MDDEIKTGEMTGEIDESITVEEDFTLLEGKAVSINDDSDNKTKEEEVYEEALDIQESLNDIRTQIKDKLLNILEKGKITDADGCEIELLNDQYNEKYNELKDLANTVIPGGKGANSESSTTDNSTTEIVKVNIDYDEILNAINEKADWLYIDEDGQVMLNGEVVPKLKVIELEAEKIKADVGEFKNLTAENFEAVNAKINNLEVGDLTATNAKIDNLEVKHGKFEDLTTEKLTATDGYIKNLQSDMAHIGTLIGGNAVIQDIQSLILTSKNTTIENALIKDAMIETVNAAKINTGVLNTNNVSIQSEDGSMLLQGNLQQFKDKAGNVRIQIGKDTTGDFTFALYGADGKGQLIDQNGIKASSISDGLIVNAMINDNANISGGKIDMSSLFTTMNNSGYTLKSSKIKFDDKNQTLDVLFNQMNTSLNDTIGKVSTNTTSIGVQQGQINQLIADTTIENNGKETTLKTAFNSVKDTVDSHTQTISSMGSTLSNVTIEYYVSTSETTQTGGSWSTDTPTWSTGKYIWQRMKYITFDGDAAYSTPVCIQGAKGDTGAPGKDGTSGITYYTWIKYADNASGSGMSNDPTGKKYIGFAYNKTTATESNTASDYTWSLIKGDKGDTGVQGPKGNDGTTYYTWIKYSDKADGTGLYDTPKSTTQYIGIAVNKTTATESTNKADYTWSKFKGDQGVKGDTGSKGQSLVKSTPQYYKSTSSTTQTGGSWTESMPSVEKGYWFWVRFKLDFENPTETKYTTPTLEQVYNKTASLEQSLDGFKTTVSNTYATNDTVGGIENRVSTVEQTASSLTSKFTDGYTMGIIEQNVEGIKVKHTSIDNNSYTHMSPTGFYIKNQGEDIFYVNKEDGLVMKGTITGSTIKGDSCFIEDTLTADTLVCKDIENPKFPQTLAGNIELSVNATTGNDDYTLDDILESYDNAEENSNDSLKKKFKSIQGAIDAMPKFLNGKTVYITMETNSTEDVFIRGVVGGVIRIYMNGKTLYGTLRSYVCTASISVYGGTRSSTEGATGVIHPNIGLSFGSRAVSVGFEASQYAALYKIKVYAPDNIPSDVSNTDKVCVASQAGTGSVYCKNIQIVNAVVGFRSNNHGAMHVNSSSGIASKYGFQAATGGVISLANNNQAGGKTGSTNKNSGGQVWYDTNGPTFASGNQTTDGGSAPVVPTTKTLTVKSSYGDTYRSTVYNNWKKDGTVRQGDYGYGDCTGCWFFGSAFSEVKGKDISKVTITIKRQSGGQHAAVGLAVKTHNYSVRPSGAPTLGTSCGTLSLATDASDTLTITNSTVLAAIKAGTVKGFGLRSSYDASHYAVCSGSATVKIYYTE